MAIQKNQKGGVRLPSVLFADTSRWYASASPSCAEEHVSAERFLVQCLVAAAVEAATVWRPLAPGLELGVFQLRTPAVVEDARVHVLRIDPQHWDLDLASVSETGEKSGHTARQWSAKTGFVAVINAGMYAADGQTHVGYLRHGGRVFSRAVNGYKSVVAWDPEPATNRPYFRIFDLDQPGVTLKNILGNYRSAVQNLRLIRRPGRNCWSQQEERWPEAALGEDNRGRILFIYCPAPLSMHDLIKELLALDLELVAAQHLEGRAPAQLYVKAGTEEIELSGVYSALSGQVAQTYPIPSVLGIRPHPREIQGIR